MLLLKKLSLALLNKAKANINEHYTIQPKLNHSFLNLFPY